MKKKLKIYSTLFVVALIVLLVAHKVRFEGYTWYQGGKDTLMFEDNAPEFYTSDTTTMKVAKAYIPFIILR